MNKLKRTSICIGVCCILTCLILSCEDKKEANNGSEYDPSQPVTVTSFYPDEGGMATRIIINGSNFGSDKEKIRVWYNQKRASIIGSNGEHLYVVTPRQPGDTCVISVAVGNDSVVFEQPFIYHTMTTVTTIAGHKGTLDFLAGTLATAEFGDPQRIVVDDEGNVFGSHRKSGDNNAGFVCWMLNEEKDIVMQLPNVSPKAGAPTLDITGRIVTFPDDGGHSFYIFDADLQWAGRKREILHPTADEIAAGIQDFTNISYKTSLATCEEDSLCYTFDYNTGSLIKFDPVSRKGQLENQFTEIANSHGMLMFHPVEKHILYIGVIQRYAFYTYNIRTKELLPYAGTAGVSGWRDGHKDDAWFGDIGQFLFDEDLNLILSDAGNHCIRKITPDGQVSTIIGKPGVAGYVDGNPEDAEFNFPRGMAIDKNYNIYISDTYNNCIRKLSVE